MPHVNITADTLKQWLDTNEAVLLDVREPAEFAAEHIAGASLVPLATITHAALPPLGDKKLVIHCRKGGRGNAACEVLLAKQPDVMLYHLEGGMEAWLKAGYPVIRAGRAFLPLDRQVQLTVGLLLLLSSALAYFVHPTFALVGCFLGAGLTFAGLTGFCGLAVLMARMPWNQKPNRT